MALLKVLPLPEMVFDQLFLFLPTYLHKINGLSMYFYWCNDRGIDEHRITVARALLTFWLTNFLLVTTV